MYVDPIYQIPIHFATLVYLKNHFKNIDIFIYECTYMQIIETCV